MSLGNFTASIDAWTTHLRATQDEFVRAVAFELAAGLIVGNEFSPGTPVDTGFARSCWYVCFDEIGPPAGLGVPLHGAGQAALDQATLTLVGAKAGHTIYILNHAEYIMALEYGHSKQAPSGFVRLTAAAGQRIVDLVARRMAA